jgi:phosphatidylethanolamine-binding protein (PEBP) family uncharacterized protein
VVRPEAAEERIQTDVDDQGADGGDQHRDPRMNDVLHIAAIVQLRNGTAGRAYSGAKPPRARPERKNYTP